MKTRILRRLQKLLKQWMRETKTADVEGTRVWIHGVVFGLKLAVEAVKAVR